VKSLVKAYNQRSAQARALQKKKGNYHRYKRKKKNKDVLNTLCYYKWVDKQARGRVDIFGSYSIHAGKTSGSKETRIVFVDSFQRMCKSREEMIRFIF